MRATLTKFLVDRVTIAAPGVENVEGSTAGGVVRTNVPAKVTYGTKLIAGTGGNEVISSAQVHLAGDDPITNRSTVTLPDSTVAHKVLKIEAPADWRGHGERHHKKVFV